MMLLFFLFLFPTIIQSVYFTNRCKIISQWWLGNQLVPEANLIIGNMYTVYLEFGSEGVSVSVSEHSNVCSYFCLSEVIYQVRYTGINRICKFSSSNNAFSTLKNCINCNHFCNQRLSTHRNLTSVDACWKGNLLSPLYNFWLSAVTQTPLPYTRDMITFLNSNPCLARISGYNLSMEANDECLQQVKTICPLTGICITNTRVLQCRFKTWSIYKTTSNLLPCTECVYDYLRYDTGLITYYDNSSSQTYIQQLINSCPGDTYVSFGGVTWQSINITSNMQGLIMANNMSAAAQTLGFSGLQIEYTHNIELLIKYLHQTTKEYGLKLDIRFNVQNNFTGVPLILQDLKSSYNRLLLFYTDLLDTHSINQIANLNINCNGNQLCVTSLQNVTTNNVPLLIQLPFEHVIKSI